MFTDGMSALRYNYSLADISSQEMKRKIVMMALTISVESFD